jgi:hypothetical protein
LLPEFGGKCYYQAFTPSRDATNVVHDESGHGRRGYATKYGWMGPIVSEIDLVYNIA